jgi:hypothetical protein
VVLCRRARGVRRRAFLNDPTARDGTDSLAPGRMEIEPPPPPPPPREFYCLPHR